MLFSLSGCACVAHVLRVRSATHARLSRFSAFALRLLVSCCCQAVARCSRTSCTLSSSSSSFSALAVCSLASHLFAGKSSVQDVQPSTTSVVLFSLSGCACVARVRLSTLRYACSPFAIFDVCSASACLLLLSGCGEVLTYFCTLRSLSSPSSTCAPCSAFGQRLARDNNSATHARLSRFSTLALRPIISLFQTRSAPRSRLSRLLPFALWQVTSLQAKKQCSRRTTKARRFAVLFDIKSVDKRCVFRLLFYIRDRV